MLIKAKKAEKKARAEEAAGRRPFASISLRPKS